MKNHVLGLVLLVFMGFSIPAMSQSSNFSTDWKALEESTNHIDVSYRLMQCSATAPVEIHLHVFNENPSSQNVAFTLNFTDGTGATGSVTVSSFPMSLGDMLTGECGSTNNSNLKVSIPSGLDYSTLTVTITYI